MRREEENEGEERVRGVKDERKNEEDEKEEMRGIQRKKGGSGKRNRKAQRCKHDGRE